MVGHKAFTAGGAGVTTALLVAALVTSVLDVAFSAIVGIPVGLLAGIAVAGGLWLGLDELSRGVRRVVTAYATFGATVFGLAALRYVNVGRSVLSLERILAIAVAVAVVVAVVPLLSDRGV